MNLPATEPLGGKGRGVAVPPSFRGILNKLGFAVLLCTRQQTIPQAEVIGEPTLKAKPPIKVNLILCYVSRTSELAQP